MKRLQTLALSLLFSLTAASCTGLDSEDVGTLVFEDAVREPEALEELEVRDTMPQRILAATPEGHLALLDPGSATPLATLVLPTEGTLVDASASVDHGAGVTRAYAIVSPGEDELAQLFTAPVDASAFGRPERLGRFGGEVRLVGTTLGAVVMQREDGARWRLARLDREPLPSTPCPLPQSVLSVSQVTADLAEIRALAFDDDALIRVDASVTLAGVTCARTAIALPRAPTRSVRGVVVGGRDVVVDAQDGFLLIAPLAEDGTAPGGLTTILAEATRVEDVAPFTSRGGRGFVAMTSGPPALVVVELALEGDALVVGSVSRTLLTGTPTEVGLGFTRLLSLRQARGAFVTSAGLVPLSVDDGLAPTFGAAAEFIAPVFAIEGTIAAD